ncbi:MAG TPA: SRPBCC family protein [Saprospiraceae bacterium]|nr:SRPBCC family protein [Saprospiraceae bacterium]HMP24141.1 SRPBCC family protein [Saprospiraceae bacterium]
MKVRQKVWQQFIPRPLDEVWHFFSRPENLDAITPDDMSFEILSDISEVPMYQGMIIQYKVSPFLGIKMNWVTEITHVRDREYFIDEQRFGPYALWHHQHHFEERDSGVLMTDILHYKIPYGFIGSIADAVFVGDKVESIFRYRIKAVERIFRFEPVTQ